MSQAMRGLRCALGLAIFAGLLAAVPLRAAEPPTDDATARREVEAAMQQYTKLLRTGPPETLAALFTADGELLEPGMSALKGPEAIRAFLAPVFTAYEVQAASTESEAVEVFGPAAYQWGTYSQRVAEKGKPAADYRGRFVASWRRDAEGHWRIARMLVQPFPAGSP
jgi:uncharacterized protein (TIGR02246 family)